MPADRALVLSLLKRHGWNATSFQILEPEFRYWFTDDRQACVAYADTGRAWVAAGAPVAPDARLTEVAESFVRAAEGLGRRASFFATERRFSASRHAWLHSLAIGQQPVWDPARWTETVGMSRSLRHQLKRTSAKGVAVRLLPSHELRTAPVRADVEALIARWLAARPMAPMGFLVDVQPFGFSEERRFFIAERCGAVVGFLAAVPVYARSGWLLEDLVRDPEAPNGTAELLVHTAMSVLAHEGSRYATLGLAPLAGQVTGALALARRLFASLYDFDGIYAFRAKLKPLRWDPIFLAYPGRGRLDPLRGIAAVFDALTAFARGRLAAFGADTVFRRPLSGASQGRRRTGGSRAPCRFAAACLRG